MDWYDSSNLRSPKHKIVFLKLGHGWLLENINCLPLHGMNNM